MTYLAIGWTNGRVAHSRRTASIVSVLPITTMEWMSSWHQVSLGNVSQVQKAGWPIAVQKDEATPPYVHPISRYITANDVFYQAFHHASTEVTNTGGEKAQKGLGLRLGCYQVHKEPEKWFKNARWQSVLEWWIPTVDSTKQDGQIAQSIESCLVDTVAQEQCWGHFLASLPGSPLCGTN